MKIKTVLLDAGGVILDESEHEEVRAQIAVELLGTIIPEYSISYYHAGVEEAVKCFCPSVYQYVFWKAVKHDGTLFERLYGTFSEEWEQRKPPLKLNAGFENELRAMCKDFEIGIAGQYGQELLELLELRSLLECFTHRLTQDDLSNTKPDLRFYDQIVKACGANPQQCVMVGDRIDKDVIPAKLLKMWTILVRVGLHKNQQPRIPFEVPDVELDGVSGLSAAVQKLAEE
ncbi:MAG: HAD family hydrolase [Candidatus Zixiibacteriota bacterium]